MARNFINKKLQKTNIYRKYFYENKRFSRMLFTKAIMAMDKK
jgi:hypothetical protein